MQLHQLENVNRDKKCENDVKMNDSTLAAKSSNGNASLLPNIHQSSQTEPVIANGKYN